jgi:hypothetical protein
MKIQQISQINNDRQNFCAIRSKNYLGGFAWDYTDSARAVQEAFENSKVLQDFCKNNDVNVSYIINSVGTYYKAATLRIEKIFPKENLSLTDKFLNLFRKKKEQIIYINAFDTGFTKVKEKLAEKISSIKYDTDIKNLWKHPYDEFNGLKSKKPKWARDNKKQVC